jgi:small subunit ribosomal protein S17
MTGKRQQKEGTVVSDKMDKTVVVQVTRTLPHPQYGKVITRAKKYYAHNEHPGVAKGSRVRIEESRPLSKLKRWVVKEVLA